MFTPSTRTFSGTPSSANVGNLTIHVEASDGKGGVTIDGFQLTVSPPPPGTRINTGGTSFTATSGAVFSADTYFSGGGTYTTTSTNDIAGTTDDFIYRSERYNMSAYNVPLPSGTYLLTLHFAEIWFGAPGGSTGGVGKRVFNVSAEGTPLLSNFDIYAQAGGAMIAVVRQFQVTVTDGVLNIAFTKVIQSPKISAIEIVASSSTTSSSSARISTSGIQTDPAAKDFLLAQEETFRFGAYPNPFRTRATLEYTPVETEEISMQLLDVQGFVVDDVYAGEVDGGTSYHFELDGSQLATGIYYVRVQSKEGSRFIRLAVVGDR
jgi:hypothetical protein